MTEGKRFWIWKDGIQRYGKVIEAYPEPFHSPLSSEPPKVAEVRLWLDGDRQPEQQMRQMKTLFPA